MLELSIERPVAGGRMLARHDGRIVFVAGAIPGERVRARIERISKQTIWAETADVLEASPDRRVPAHDAACGGAAFAHVAYARQLSLKQEILVDAFRRLGRVTIDPPAVAASPESGYRLRARLHVSGGRAGFFRENSHVLCDAAATGQLLPEATAAASAALDALGPRARDCESIIISENIAASQRVLHLEARDGARLDDAAAGLRHLVSPGTGVTGVTTMRRAVLVVLAGEAAVADDAMSLMGEAASTPAPVLWRRRAPSFFQANRHLIGRLVRRVLELAPGRRVADLYAGVGLFAIALAARGADVTAVESEPFAAGDLASNAEPLGTRVIVVKSSVEEMVHMRPDRAFDVVVLDPPRAGVSQAALRDLAAWRVPRLVYVSCDPPTLARDTARLHEAGYRLASVDGFDLFPNTAHVEAAALFTRQETS